ncbi:hypothetical protein [Nocardia sp. BMG51109]|uniref:hypothetical protein n=1 Tax=Nocardia sp. BMG51109 TaxID=1056816 RepID=UPI0004B0F33A|nr:hypothetical protein [Nocardia sp. BMG51109]
MTRIAITGHRGLPSATTELVDKALRSELAERTDDELVGSSCLADGADALFARAVLDARGSLVVVVPRSSIGTVCLLNITRYTTS